MDAIKKTTITREDFSTTLQSDDKRLSIVIDMPIEMSQELQEDLEPLIDFFYRLRRKSEYKVIDS